MALAAAYTALQQGIEPARLELDANLDLLCGQLLKITEPASPKPQFETATETDAFSQQNAAIRHIAGLTERQREIMGLVLEGHPSKNIAADLGISQRTVENHRACMMKRTGAKSLPALARMAFIASGSTGHATSQMAPKLYPADAVEEDAEVSEEQVQGLKARSRG